MLKYGNMKLFKKINGLKLPKAKKLELFKNKSIWKPNDYAGMTSIDDISHRALKGRAEILGGLDVPKREMLSSIQSKVKSNIDANHKPGLKRFFMKMKAMNEVKKGKVVPGVVPRSSDIFHDKVVELHRANPVNSASAGHLYELTPREKLFMVANSKYRNKNWDIRKAFTSRVERTNGTSGIHGKGEGIFDRSKYNVDSIPADKNIAYKGTADVKTTLAQARKKEPLWASGLPPVASGYADNVLELDMRKAKKTGPWTKHVAKDTTGWTQEMADKVNMKPRTVGRDSLGDNPYYEKVFKDPKFKSLRAVYFGGNKKTRIPLSGDNKKEFIKRITKSKGDAMIMESPYLKEIRGRNRAIRDAVSEIPYDKTRMPEWLQRLATEK